MKIIFSLILLITTLITKASFYQRDSIQQQNDSIQISRMQQISIERLADSLKRAELERQVTQLTSTDNLKKSALIQELNALKKKDSIRTVRQKQQVDSLKRFVKGFPVVFVRDTLFNIYTRQGSFTPKERADAITNRLIKVSDDYAFAADSIKLVAAEETMDLVYKNNLIMTISDQDALWQNTNKDSLAKQFKLIISSSIAQYRDETSFQTLLEESLLALLVVGVVVLIIYLINRLFKWLSRKIEAKKGTLVKGVFINRYELLNSNQQLSLINTVITAVKWFFIFLAVYLSLPVLFGIFPFTRDISNSLINYILSPLRKIGLAVWKYIPNLITIIVLVVIFRYVLKLLRYIKLEIQKGRLHIPGFYADWANPTYQIIRVLVLAFMLIVIFPYMPGSDSPIFKGVSVFIGVLFTFGSAGALGNIVAGLVLTYMRAFKINDRVKIGDVTGDIIEKTLLVTRIRTIHNEIISIPNSTVMSSHTINYSSDAPDKGLVIHTTITIGYDVNWRTVYELLINAAKNVDLVEQEPKPYVLQTGFDDYYVNYTINAFTKHPNKQAIIYSALYENIQDQFNQAGIEIMSIHYLSLRNGENSTIPADYLKNVKDKPK